MRRLPTVLLIVASIALAGCRAGGTASSAILAGAFYRADSKGATTAPQAPLTPPADATAALPQASLAIAPARLPDSQPLEAIAPAAKTEPAAAIAGPTTLPAPQDAADLPQYLTAGAVIADVSGTPIYADKVFQSLVPSLSAEAKQRDLDSYTAYARLEISKKIMDSIQSEMWFTAAVQNLTADEKTAVENYTMKLRHDLVTAAQGSEALARRRAVEEGTTLDDKIKDMYRKVMFDLLRQRKILPHIKATADELRAYYDQHKAEFTETAQARFRVIRINARTLNDDIFKGRDMATERIKELHDRAVNMSDDGFAKLAAESNTDAGLKRTSGLVGGPDGWVAKGAFVVPEVEEKVWALQPGEVTEPVQVGDSYYIARLEKRNLGRVQPFEDEEVQARIRIEIEQPLAAMRQEQYIEKLSRDAVVYPDVMGEPDLVKRQQILDQMIQPVLEMAVQKYPEWAGK